MMVYTDSWKLASSIIYFRESRVSGTVLFAVESGIHEWEGFFVLS